MNPVLMNSVSPSNQEHGSKRCRMVPYKGSSILRGVGIVAMVACLGGCAGAVVGAVADVAIEVVKVPFKVVGAVIDVATDDD